MLILTPSIEPGLQGRMAGAGACVVLVNCGETPYDGVATLQVWAGIGEVIPPAVELARQTLAGQPGRS